MPDDIYRFGRVIRSDVVLGGEPNNVLIYLYRASSPTKTPVPAFTKHDLLLPPLFIMPVLWTRGYFENVEHRALKVDDVFRVHCFWDDMQECYVDENEQPLKRRSQPCGSFLLTTVSGIDDETCRALGIPLSPYKPDHLLPRSKRFYKNRLAELLEEGLSQEEADLKAMQDTVVQMGERVEDYAWPEPNGGKKRSKKP